MHHISSDLNRQATAHEKPQMNISDAAKARIDHLHRAMQANYGGLFTSRVTTTDELKAWESLWMAAFDGKKSESIILAVRACFAKYKVPFSIAEFHEAYRSTVAVCVAHQRNNEALALPKTTWAERKKQGQEALAEMRMCLS